MEFVDKLLEFFGKHVHPAVFAAVVTSVAWVASPAVRRGEFSTALIVIVFGLAFLSYPIVLKSLESVSKRVSSSSSRRRWRLRAINLPEYSRAVLAYFARNSTAELVDLSATNDLLPLETGGFVRRVDEYGGAAKFQLTRDAQRWFADDYQWVMGHLTASVEQSGVIASRESKALERWSRRWMAG